ncbi:conserved hypothetical protein [Magnetospirillum sp. LM-5]|uniref:lysophospholipid acyltransferase family protein n=1 Tax=Magnetospirillum sp. LM-5 TaxID=2681466 RepID=UPI001385A7F3|nr:lysophospholipid acyltransferase family protein [Magnetospirillum sp. LM-5]CAA7617996.1 conserved hypothetical protein [Magnetospirillum sp. LM-5]
MGLAKQIGKSETLRGTLCWLVSLYIRLLYASGSWQVVRGDIPAAFWDQGKPFILSFWHGRILMMMKCWRPGVPISMLISQHRDGLLIARTVAHFGIKTVAGSTTRGGGNALRGLLKMLKGGECIGITPDGPKGPRMRASAGFINIARLSGCPIIPVAYSARRRKLLGSWDRFVIPWPFSGGVFVWGEPMHVTADSDIEECRRLLEDRMIAVTDEADHLAGVEPVAPADPLPETAP